MTTQEAQVEIQLMVALFQGLKNGLPQVDDRAVASMAETLYSMNTVSANQKARPQKGSGGSYQKKEGGNYAKPSGEHGFCKDCKSPNAYNPKTGKTFCSEKCWLNNSAPKSDFAETESMPF